MCWSEGDSRGIKDEVRGGLNDKGHLSHWTAIVGQGETSHLEAYMFKTIFAIILKCSFLDSCSLM